MSVLELKSMHKLFRVTISSIKCSTNAYSDIISLQVYKNSPYKTTLPLGLLGYCGTNAKISPTVEIAYRVNNILKLLDICQSTILKQELSINKKISDPKPKPDYLLKTL